MAPRKLLAAAGVFAALALGLVLLRSAQRAPAFAPGGPSGPAGAASFAPGGAPPRPLASAAAAARSGLFGTSLIDGMLRTVPVRPEARTEPPPGQGMPPEDGGGAAPRGAAVPAAGAGPAGNGGAAEAGRPELELIRMKERERGERRMYGGGSPRAPSRPARRAGMAPPDEAEIISSFSSFLKRLNAAGPQASEGALDGEERRAAASYGESQAVLPDPIDERHRTPAMELLHGMNLDSVHAVRMSANPGLQDGSKDKAGKKFDGNLKTFEFVPVEKTKGAFGTTVIRRSGAEETGD